jgi:hypothetical protein
MSSGARGGLGGTRGRRASGMSRTSEMLTGDLANKGDDKFDVVDSS